MNIITKKQNNNNYIINNNLSYSLDKITNYSPCEWKNSIYSYNVSYNKSLINTNKITNYLFNWSLSLDYLGMLDGKEIKLNKRNRIKSKRLSGKKNFLSTPNVKHTNNETIISLYVFNKKRIFLKKKLLNSLSRKKLILIYKSLYIINIIYNKSLHYKYDINKKLLFLLILSNKRIFKYLKKILSLNQILLLELKKTTDLYFYYKKQGLVKLINKVYNNNNTKFDIINQKVTYLNSDILTECIDFKAKDRKKNILHILNRALSIIKLAPKYIFLINNGINNLKNNTLSCLKYKTVSGIKIKASGRLTRRLTALRSITKVKNKGGLQNIDSCYKGLSTYISRGYVISNLQLTQKDSKTRNGAFGLKCWISSS